MLVLGGLLMVSALESTLLVELALSKTLMVFEAASFASLPMLLLAPQKLLDKKTRTAPFLYVDNLRFASRAFLNCPVEAFV